MNRRELLSAAGVAAGITTSQILQPVKAIAREAWELLLRRMNGEASPVQRLELRAEIKLRDSVHAVGRERRRA